MDEKVKEIEKKYAGDIRSLNKDRDYLLSDECEYQSTWEEIAEIEYLLSVISERENELLGWKNSNHNWMKKASGYWQRIKDLEEGIEQHKSTPYVLGCLVIASEVLKRDEELYKLIEKKGE
jgi:hypothetical protein